MLKLIKRKLFSSIAIYSLNRSTKKHKVTCNGFTWFNKSTIVHKNCHFNGLRVYGKGKVTIGENFHSGKSVVILTQNHNYHGSILPYDDIYIVRDVHIGRNVWIGMDVIILGGVTIGEGAIIQAGSVVVSDIPPLAIAGGSPCKVFSSRNSDHYYSLLDE